MKARPASGNVREVQSAEKLYVLQARAMDPADPAPLRYWARLYRLIFGDGTSTRRSTQFTMALAGPLPRVAMHGHNTTIHEGDFQKGLHLRSFGEEYPTGARIPQSVGLLKLRRTRGKR